MSFNNEPWKLVMSAPKQAHVETQFIATDRPAARRMLNENQVLEIIPVSRTTLPHGEGRPVSEVDLH